MIYHKHLKTVSIYFIAMLEQIVAIEGIPGLEDLVAHFKKEYGDPFLNKIKESRLGINISRGSYQAQLQWERDYQHPELYILSAVEGYLTGYAFIGHSEHHKNKGYCYIPLSDDQDVALLIVCNYRS